MLSRSGPCHVNARTISGGAYSLARRTWRPHAHAEALVMTLTSQMYNGSGECYGKRENVGDPQNTPQGKKKVLVSSLTRVVQR
jgi:hypothetical protein